MQGLVVQPADAAASGVPEDRIAEKNIRPVNKLITALTALDPAPLHQPRTPETRVIGTCRHFATIACAILRARGIAARARCGFGTYFLRNHGVDHWITEYRDDDQHRWVRVDTEHVECLLLAEHGEVAHGVAADLMRPPGMIGAGHPEQSRVDQSVAILQPRLAPGEAKNDPPALARLLAHEDLAVPQHLLV